MSSSYSGDLSYIHDAGFGQFAEAAGTLLLDELQKRGIDNGLIVDLGCGSGILGTIACDAGYDVLGVDISAPFIALARERVPRGQFVCASLLDFEIPKCVAVASIGVCVNYLFDDKHSVESVWALFGRVYKALRSGGIFLFDAAGPGRAGVDGRSIGYTDGGDWFVAYSAAEDAASQTLTRRITSFRRDGDTYRRTDEEHMLRLLAQQDVIRELDSLGFVFEVLNAYGDQALPAGWSAYKAMKR